MGFGHRVYKNYDPRAKIIKKACDDVFEVTGVNPLLKIAQELEKIALEDEYFVKRKLYPNVDFYSGLIYEALQFPPEMFTVLFAIGRTPGWLAQWSELVQDKEQKIARPKQIYTGIRTRDFVPIARAVATACRGGGPATTDDQQVDHPADPGGHPDGLFHGGRVDLRAEVDLRDEHREQDHQPDPVGHDGEAQGDAAQHPAPVVGVAALPNGPEPGQGRAEPQHGQHRVRHLRVRAVQGHRRNDHHADRRRQGGGDVDPA